MKDNGWAPNRMLVRFKGVSHIAVAEKTAAALFDMKPITFRNLVENGALPRPVSIGGLERWKISELEAVLSGEIGFFQNGDIEV